MTPLPDGCDLAVIGAGIVGLAAARELVRRHPAARIVVLEAADEVATGQTARNSGVVHAGIYYTPGSLKARLCVAGARETRAFCAERGIAYEAVGKLVVATEAAELPALDELERRGHANAVPGLRRVGPEEIRELEPHAAGVAALHSPGTAVADFAAVARACAEDLRRDGGEVVTGAAVARARRPERRRAAARPPRGTSSRATCSPAPVTRPAAWPSSPARRPTRASSPSAGPTCACAAPSSCAG